MRTAINSVMIWGIMLKMKRFDAHAALKAVLAYVAQLMTVHVIAKAYVA